MKLMSTGRSAGRSGAALRGAFLAVLATMVAVFTLQSPGMADEGYAATCAADNVICETGVKVTGPQGECLQANADFHHTIVCVEYNGDYIYVKDNQVDDKSALGTVYSENGVNFRLCRNTYGNATWVRCNFDWAEAGKHHVEGGYKNTSTDLWTTLLWRWSGK